MKSSRLAGIDDMEAGNAFLPGFMEDYNGRFALVPARSGDLHRPMNLAPDRLKEILCKREQRYVGAQLTFSFESQGCFFGCHSIGGLPHFGYIIRENVHSRFMRIGGACA
ncbi:hypothetical protein QO004_000003 [Rhizobium mesoamericanum]|nr:hypothetical protein [Rhizobium mesoamericanum]